METNERELNKAVDEAVQTVATWRDNVAKINKSINEAHTRIAAANEVREQHALAASLNDAKAIAELGKARREHAEAEASLHDLKIALDGAQTRLQDALRDENSARMALNQHNGRELMLKRIQVAAKLDGIFADMAAAYREYEELGREISNLDVTPRSFAGIADHQGTMGARRVRAAMPRFMWSLFPGALHDELKNEPLEVTEGRHFGFDAKVVGDTVVNFVKPRAAS